MAAAGTAGRSRSWPWVLLGCGGAALLVLLLMAACTMVVFSGGSGSEGSGDDSAGEDGAGESEAEVGIGEAGTIGQWQVTVESVETAPTYEGAFGQEQAQGEFWLVELTVENTGNESTTFDDSNLTLVGVDDANFSADALVADDSLFLEQINPGNRVTGTAVFDAPEGTDMSALEVEDLLSMAEPLEISLD